MTHSAPEAKLALDKVTDYLREKRKEEPSFSDIVSLAEVMAESLQSFFKSMDTAIYRELSTISEYISLMRSEIGALQIDELSGERLPSAGKELAAIVQATEKATNTIMECAETVLAADVSDFAAYKDLVDDKMMAIFEACSFQDITGQRVSKVVDTIECIERRVDRFSSVMPNTIMNEKMDALLDADEQLKKQRQKDLILHGPALDGEGVDQFMVDSLLEAAFGDEEKPKKAKAK